MGFDVVDVLADLEGAVDQLVHTDVFAYADGRSIIKLQVLRTQIEYALDKEMAEFEASGEWAKEGAKDAASWVATRSHLPLNEARAQVRRGQALASLPIAAEAFSHGEIGAAQVDVLARAAAAVEASVFVHDELLLVEVAKGLKFGQFNAAVSYWTQCVNPEGSEAAELARQARRSASSAPTLDGMVQVRGLLPAIDGSIVTDELRRLADQLFDADWAEAKAELGREPKMSELRRSTAQRWADAMVEMAIRSRTAPADGRRPEPLFSVLVDYPTLSGPTLGGRTLPGRMCQLENGQVVTPGSLGPWMDEASFERIVFAPGKRAEVSVKARFFTGATRRAIEVRDLQCTHEYCELPAERCQIDHVIPYAKGGETKQENGDVLCGFHNRLRNGEPKVKDRGKARKPNAGDGAGDGDDGPEVGEPGRPPESGEHGPEPGG
jgi:Domain of unknown function (DUF222)